MSNFSLNLPINSVSFGQVSLSLLREVYSRKMTPNIFPIGKVDLSTSKDGEDFKKWLSFCIQKAPEHHSRDIPAVKLWHLAGGFESVSKNQLLISFYELDSPTQFEKNVACSNVTAFSSKYTCEVFKKAGIDTFHLPLGFDSHNFSSIDKTWFDDGRITFNLCGKFEKRKNHAKVIKAWLKKFGNDARYSLQISCYNHFLTQEQNSQIINSLVSDKVYFNVNNVGWIQTNELYSDFLNSGDIIIAMSGGEGWGIPEFTSVALGKHAVVLNAHGYKDWATNENAVLVNPSNKEEVYDNIFFKKGQNINQGNIFSFNEDEFIAGCESVIERVKQNRKNVNGLKLQEDFSYSKTLNSLLALSHAKLFI